MFFNLRTGRCGTLFAVLVCLGFTAACGQTNAEPPEHQGEAGALAAETGCAIPLPAEVPVPDKLVIETCTPSDKISGFHGKAPLPKDIDASFDALKASYAASGYTLYDNSNGKIRSFIFGGKGHRKGEMQLNPKEGYLSVSVNLYPENMED
ncbi:MAG: hypothetical protein R3B94_08990 [Hyphomonas sp.]